MLTARAFLFFAHPAQMSGDAVWTAVDGYAGATALSPGFAGGIENVISSGITGWTLRRHHSRLDR